MPIAVSILGLISQLQRSNGRYSCSVPRSCVATKPTLLVAVEPAGVAVNSKGHIYVFHRGKHPLMEFDSSGKFIRCIADDLFVTAHIVRVDPEDHIWTTDIGRMWF